MRRLFSSVLSVLDAQNCGGVGRASRSWLNADAAGRGEHLSLGPRWA